MYKFKNSKTVLMLIQVLALMPYLFFIFYLFDLWFDVSRTRVLESNLNDAKMVSLYLHENIQHGLSLAKTLAYSPDLLDIYREKPESGRKSMRYIVDNNQRINSIYLVDTEGKILLFESKKLIPKAVGSSVVDMDYFKKIMATGKSYVSDPLIGKLAVTNIVTMGEPVLENGNIKAIVVSAIDIDSLKSQLEKYMSDTGNKYIYILDRSGSLVFSPFNNIDNGLKTSLKNESFLKEVSKGREGLLNNCKIPIMNKTVIGAVVAVNDFQWTVISIQPTADIFAPLFKLQSITWLVILSSLAFSMLIISYYIKKIKYII